MMHLLEFFPEPEFNLVSPRTRDIIDVSVVILLMSFFLFGVLGCDTRQEVLQNSGIFGEHELARIEQVQSVNGSLGGCFFLGTGFISGKIQTEHTLQFYWSPEPNEYVVTSLPYNIFRFIIDETKDVPSVEFVFKEKWLNQEIDHFMIEGISESAIANLNSFILNPKALSVAKIRISSRLLEEEIYLPQL